MKFLVTAGPTHEPIDPVRFLGNRSSGKMGYAIAAAARDSGHEVTLISGPVCLAPPTGVELVRVRTAAEMYDAVHAHLAGIDVLVMAAAVADYSPANTAPEKIKKTAEHIELTLVRTRDILKSLPREKKIFIVGFAAETRDVARYAREKLVEKNCDLVVANDVSRMDTGFESDDNEISLHFKHGEARALPRASKRDLAQEIVRMIAQTREKC